VGPVLLTPLSDYFGRPPVYVSSRFILFTLQLLVAPAPNIGTMLGRRFISGFAGGAPLTNTGGTVSDLWKRKTRVAVYALSSTFGPPVALVLSGYIGQNYRCQRL